MVSKATSEEVQSIINRLVQHYKSRKYKILLEKPLHQDSPYRTSIILSKNDEIPILIEAQTKLYYHEGLRSLIEYNLRNRENCEVYIAVYSTSILPAEHISKIKREGVGLIFLEENNEIATINQAKNFSLIVTPDPNLIFGKYSLQVKGSIHKFNEVNRKDGLRDLFEVFESSVEDLGVKAIGKNKFLSLNELGFKKKDLNGRIDILGADDAYRSSQAIVDGILKTDLHSFRNARNLCDHRVRSKKEEYRRQIQFPDKMMLGCRLIHELVELTKKIK